MTDQGMFPVRRSKTVCSVHLCETRKGSTHGNLSAQRITWPVWRPQVPAGVQPSFMSLVALYFKHQISPKGVSSLLKLSVASARKGKCILGMKLDGPGALGSGT